MGKSKKQSEFERIEEQQTNVYSKFTDEQLIKFVNVHWQNKSKRRRIAVNNEIKRRGLKID